MCKDLLANLGKDDIRDDFGIRDGQRQLREIVNDPAALYMIGQAAGILPYLDHYDGGGFLISYKSQKKQ